MPADPTPPADTAGDVDPPGPVEAGRYRVLLQVWVLAFLTIILTGFANFLRTYFQEGR